MKYLGVSKLLLLLLLAYTGFASGAEPVIDDEPDFYEAPGANKTRNYDVTDNLVIDTFSGTLQTQSADLVVPGTGPDITVLRAYNSVPSVLSEYSYMGPGWDIHFGRIIGLYTCADNLLTPQSNKLFFVKPDGSQVEILPQLKIYFDKNNNQNYDEDIDYRPAYATTEFWRVECRGSSLVVTDKLDTDYYFGSPDTTGHLTKQVVVKVEDTHGNTLDIAYEIANAFTRPTSITASDGRQVNFTYTGFQLSAVTDGEFTLNYLYTGQHLTQVLFPEGVAWNYEYKDSTRLLSKVVTPLGAEIGLTWDNYFSLEKDYPIVISKCVDDRCWKYSYNRELSTPTGLIDKTIIETPYSTREEYTHVTPRSVSSSQIWKIGVLSRKEIFEIADGSADLDKPTTCDTTPEFNNNSIPIQVFEYEWEGHSISDRDRVYKHQDVVLISTEYSLPRLKSQTETHKNGTSYRYEVLVYTPSGRPVYILEEGNKTRYTYLSPFEITAHHGQWFIGAPKGQFISDHDGNYDLVSGVDYNEKGLVTHKVNAGKETFFDYYNDGTVQSETDGAGNTTKFSNYYRGIARRVDFPDGTYITRIVDSRGRITSETDQKLTTTTFEYDALDRITHIDMPVTLDVSIDYLINSAGGMRKTFTKGSLLEIYEHDALGNLLSHSRKDNSTGKEFTRLFEYNTRDQIIFESFVNETSKGTRYDYDSTGTLITTYTSNGERVNRDINAYSTTVTDSRCNKTTHYFDAFSASDQYLKRIEAPESVLIEITRNILGQPLTITQNGVTRQFGYDDNWMLNYFKDPEADADHHFVYDAAGRKVYARVGVENDAQAYVINYTYDTLGRLTGEIYSSLYIANQTPWSMFMPESCGGSSAGTSCYYQRFNDTFSYSYDETGNLKAKVKNTSGMSWGYAGIITWENSTSWTYQHDDEGRLESEELSYHGNNVFRLNYAYNEYGYMTDVMYPDGYVVDYSPDTFGRPSKAGNIVVDVQHYDAGPLKSLTYGNGQIANYTINSRYLPETFSVRQGGTDLLSLQYTYDLNGNITAIQDHAFPAKSQIMDYDNLDRLINASGIWGSSSHIYDAMSNIVHRSVGTRNFSYQYDSSHNRVTQFDGKDLDYDIYGRVIQEGAQRYFYDFSNNLTKASASPAAGDIQFAYDANGRMQSRTASNTDRFVYNSAGKLMYEVQTDGDIKRSHIYLGSKLVGYHDIRIQCHEDLDADGLTHCFERQNGLNPYLNDATSDKDGDGLSNLQEQQLGTKAGAKDSDSDGIADGYEVEYGLNPVSGDSQLDADGDGFSNLEEYMQGSNPLTATTLGSATNFNASFAQSSVVVTWNPVKYAEAYDLYWSTNPFSDISTASRIGNVTSPYIHPAIKGEATRYYRLISKKGSLQSTPTYEVKAELVEKAWIYVGTIGAEPDQVDVDNAGNAHILKHADPSGVDINFWDNSTQSFTGYDIIPNEVSGEDMAVSRDGYAMVLSANASTRSIWASIFDPAKKNWTTTYLNKVQSGALYLSDLDVVASDNGNFVISWKEEKSPSHSRWVRTWNPASGWSPIIRAGYLDPDSPYYNRSTHYYHAMDINNNGDMAIAWLLSVPGANTSTLHLLTRTSNGNQSIHYIANVNEYADLVVEVTDDGDGVMSWKADATGDAYTQRFDMTSLIGETSPLGMSDPGVFALHLDSDKKATAFATDSGIAKVSTQLLGQTWHHSASGSFESISYSPRKAVSVVDSGLHAVNHATTGDPVQYHEGTITKVFPVPSGFSPVLVSSATLSGNYVRVARVSKDLQKWPVYLYKAQTPLPNTSPVAIAGSDIEVTTEKSVKLSAQLSYDSDGVILSYAWKQISGPAVKLLESDYPNTTVDLTTPMSHAVLEFEVTVTDDRGGQAKDVVVVTIDNPYGPPIANSGPDQQVVEGDIVQLDASKSQPAQLNPITGYTWQQISGPAITLTNSESSTPTFTAPEVTSLTTLQFKVTVNTGTNYYYTSTDTVTITVKDDEPPIANFGADQTVNTGTKVVLNYSQSRDPDGGSISMQFTVISGTGIQLQNGTASGTLEFTAPSVSQDTIYTFRVTVTDDEGDTAYDDVSVTVKAPVITALTSNAGPDQIVRSKAKVTLDGSGSKAPSGVTITKYSWARVSGPSVTLSSSTAVKPTFTAATVTSAQTLVMRLTITGSNGKTASDTVSITIKPGTNKVPIANAGADQTVNEGATVVLSSSGSSDPDGTSLSLSWSVISGGALTLQQGSVTGTVQFIAPNVAADTTYVIQLKVTDVEGASATDQVSVTVKNVPVITPPASACELDFNGNGVVEEVDFYGENYEGIFYAVYIYLNYNAQYGTYFPNTPVSKLDWNGDGTVTMEEVYTGTISVDTLHTFQTQHWFYLNDKNAYANYYPNSGCAL